jgi:hypothetical protein
MRPWYHAARECVSRERAVFKLMGMLILYAIAALAIGFWFNAADPFSGVLLAVPIFLLLLFAHFILTRP